MLLYFYTPLMILLGVNLILFWLTAMHLWRQRRESRRVFTGANSSAQGQKDKDQIKMYLKLFLLMGFTSVILIISIVSGESIIGYYIVATLLYLRGPLIFWCCIWSRKNVRKALLAELCCRLIRSKVQQTASMDISLIETPISVTNASGDLSRNSNV